MTTKECAWCDKSFVAAPSDPRKYCSLECYYRRTYAAGALPSGVPRDTETRECVRCHKDFRAFVFDNPKRLFCTAQCANTDKKAKRIKTERRKSYQSFRYMSWAIEEQLTKQQSKCFWCGAKINSANFHHDHLFPLSKGGDDELYNLVLACPSCNLAKGDLMPWEFIKKLNLHPLVVQPAEPQGPKGGE